MTKKKQSLRRIWMEAGAAILLILIVGIVYMLHGGLTGGKGSYHQKEVVQAASVEDYTKKDYEKQQKFLEENQVEASFYDTLEEFAFRTSSALWNMEIEVEMAENQEKSSRMAKNLLYSPLSLYYALALTAEGATRETEEELLGLLAVSDTEQLSDQMGKLYRRLYRENEDSAFRIANSLWMAEEWNGEEIRWKPEFLETASSDFYASLFSVDFSSPATGKAMGEWVSDQTKGLLEPEFQTEPRVLEHKGVYEQLLGILNTIYLKDRWGRKFYVTEEEAFFLEDKTEKRLPFLKRTADGTVYQGEHYNRASLSLENTGEMVFVLPEEGIRVTELLADSEQLKEAFTGGEAVSAEIVWEVPKFTYQMEQDWKQVLRQLGISSAFDEEKADFSNMVETDTEQALFVNEVRQGVRLAIDEEGIEAAAYSYVAMGTKTAAREPESLEKIEMILNRPFLYGIKYEGTYLFIGVCGDPTEEK